MNKKKILTYLLSGLIPVLIFFIAASLNNYFPTGKELLNVYDSFTQYPGMILELARNLFSNSILFSWHGGLGFNFLGSITYYGFSPLNIFSLFTSPESYHIYITIMTYLRFFALGISMCFYLTSKNTKSTYTILFSTIYALMGYTSTYYYNYIWIDSIIMLPLVIYGLDKLIEKEKPGFYIFALGITILINYYIGYMICIFSLIWFIYKIIFYKEKKNKIKMFIISSLLSGLIGSLSLIPSFFALLMGKADLYSSINYFGLNENFKTFLYTLTSGTYIMDDQMNGPALVYSSILSLVLSIFYFFNTHISKKEKIASLIILLFFYLSFSVNLLNYAWQFFQSPIWWNSRFSFLFSFFLITLSIRSLENIKYTQFTITKRIITLFILFILIGTGAYFKWSSSTTPIYSYIYLGLSLLLIIEMFFLIDKPGFMIMLIIFTFVELGLNTFNSLKNNYNDNSYMKYAYLKEELPPLINKLNTENEYFYRMELLNDFTSNDGLYFGYNGINYFNSARNIKVMKTMKNLGVNVSNDAHIELKEFDPVLMSILNIKYLYGSNVPYFKNVDLRLYENPYPLALGIASNKNIREFEFDNNANKYQTRENILKSLTGKNDNLYIQIFNDQFIKEKIDKDTNTYTYSFQSDDNYLIIPEDQYGEIIINENTHTINKEYESIKKGDKVKIIYKTIGYVEPETLFITLLNLDSYSSYMNSLGTNILHSKTNINNHILEGTIDIENDNDYLFTTIPYEQGMKIYLDGKETNHDIILGSFIGIKLTPGHHEIYIDYIPKGLKLGLTLSIISFIISLIYLQFNKKKL